METASNIVNLIIVLFCFCSIAKFILNYMRADDDERIATGIILGVIAVLIAGNGLYIAMKSNEKSLDLWVNIFLCSVLGLLLQQVYKAIRDVSKIPAKAFARCLIGVGIVTTLIEIFL